MKNIYKAILVVLFLLLVGFMLKKGFENKVDPLWKNTKSLVNTQTHLLRESRELLQKTYDSIHPQQKNVDVINLISKPFLPKVGWKKFNTLLKKVISEKKVVILGVSGTGKTTLVDRIALIISGNKNQITKVTCVEGLEEDYNKQWVGHYDKNGFKPGKLLNLFHKCEINPKKNYVLIIDDFDKTFRTSFFGAAIWNELDTSMYNNTIEGYNKSIKIPDNLFLISLANPANQFNYPFSSEDYRRLTNGEPYILAPNFLELKEYLLEGKKHPLNTKQKETLIKKLYYYSKINSIIENKIGRSAMIGQWSGIRKSLKENNLKATESYIRSHLAKFELFNKLQKDDFENIYYTLNSNGRLKNSNFIVTNFKKLIKLGLFSELSVAILFAMLSAIGFRRSYLIKKRNLDNLIDKIKNTETKYYNNVILYHQTYGSLLSIKDEIHEISKKGKLNFSQANYLIQNLEETLKVIDFVHALGDKHNELKNFMKTVVSDDDITQEEFDEHIQFLNDHKSEIDSKTFYRVKQQLIKLFYKSKVKHGRIKV